MSNTIRIDEDINTIIPEDSLPIVWLSRDVRDGRADSLVDVWSAQPLRYSSQPFGAGHRAVYTDGGDGNESTLIGRFSPAQVRERFGIVPLADESICIDNPKVN